MRFGAKKLRQGGYTLIEMAIATGILAVMATTVILANRFVNQQSVQNQDHTFATEKAIQMYEELRALVSGNENLGINVLQNYSNYLDYDTVLTTDKNVDTGLSTANPGDPLSGNVKTSSGNWRYMRLVDIEPVANDPQARKVTVKVFLYPGDFVPQTAPITATGTLLATVGGILRTSQQPNVPTQVMDLYILQINNIPSWWSVLPTLATSMQADVADLQSRVNGLKLRAHYITRTSYGRDYWYQPETNSYSHTSESTHQQWVYYYPGITPQEDIGAANDFWYFDPETAGDPNSLLMCGNFMVDGTSYPVTTAQFQGASTGVSTGGYSVADQFNNAMRYPDEMAAYAAVTAAYAQAASQGVTAPAGVTEISERMLLEGMMSQPASFQNSIIVNLHGELLPLPPLRNYSDAAKDPGNQLAIANNAMACTMTQWGVTTNTNVRVVAHPELLYYPQANPGTSQYVTVRYRVYAYYDGESLDNGGASLPTGDPRVPAISLFLPDSPGASVVGVTAIVGNSDSLKPGNPPWPYGYATPAGGGPYVNGYGQSITGEDPGAVAMNMGMSMAVTYVGANQPLITLFNTPLRCGEYTNVAPPATPSPVPNLAFEEQPGRKSAVKHNAGTKMNPDLITYCAITNDGDGTDNVNNAVTQTHFNYTVGSAGSNNFLVVQTDCQDGGATNWVKSCSYDGVNLTRAVSVQAAGEDSLETWYLAGATTGTHPISVVMNSTTSYGLIVGASSYYNAVALGAVTASGGQASNSSHSVTLTTLDNDSYVVSSMEFDRNKTISVTGGGQNQIFDSITAAPASTFAFEGDYQAAAAPGPYVSSYSTSDSHIASLTSIELVACTSIITPSNTPTWTGTPTNTPTVTNTPIPPSATPTPTFTNGPCTIAYTSAVTYSSNNSTVSNASLPCTVVGANNLLIAQINIQDNGGTQTVKSCYFNGASMTQAVGFYDNTNNHGDLETWYIAESASVTGTLSVTINGGAATLVVGAIAYQGVNQTTPIGNTATLSGQGNEGSPNHFIPLTTTTNDSWIVGLIEYNNNDTAISPFVGTQQQRWYEQTSLEAAGDDMPTGTQGTYQLQFTSGTHSADMEAVELIPCFIGPTPTSTVTNTPVPFVPSNTFTPTPTPVNTATPTPTPGGANAGGGLNAADRLYGAEYIPCVPEFQDGTSLTNASYIANNYTFTSRDLTNINNGGGYPKNTARWIISVQMPVTAVFGSSATIYSGPIQPNTASATIIGQHALEVRLGNAVTTSAVTLTQPVANTPATIFPNLERTYIWCGPVMPPYTEQYQFTGDPRDCPYYDVKFGGPPIAGGVSIGGVTVAGAVTTTGSPFIVGPNAYNWWFKNGNGSVTMAADGYSGFGASGGSSPWEGCVPVDMPRYYQLVRQGLLSTTSIWTGTNGFTWFYYGLGGEVGSDQYPRSNGVEEMSDLYMTTYNAGAPVSGYNDILGDGSGTGAWKGGLWLPANIKANSGTYGWYARPWLGELYPDKSYLSAWVSYGNLPSVANTTIPAASQPETFYLTGMLNIKTSGPAGASDDGFMGNKPITYLPNPNGNGANSFYNGYNTVTKGTFNHEYDSWLGTELAIPVTTYNIYPFPLAEGVSVQRAWDLDGGFPNEYNLSPYNTTGMRTLIDVPSVTNVTSGGTTYRLFYDYNQNGATPYNPYAAANVNPYGSGVIRCNLLNSAGVTSQVGYVVEQGTAPSGNVGVQTLAETALVLGLRTFLDGGQMAATNQIGHITQLPLVKIFLAQALPEYNASGSVSFIVGSPVTATSNGGGAVSVGMPVTNIWWRFNANGLANYYTEEYPNYDQPMTTETGNYQESVTVVYNLKWSNDGGKSWKFVQDAAPATFGVCDCNLAGSHAVTLAAPWGYNWPVATGNGGSILTQGLYELMVEAYRYNYGEHYAYDIQNLEVSW